MMSQKKSPIHLPGYINLHQTGELKSRAQELWEMMADCQLCPRKCQVNRLKGEKGVCRADSKLKIAAYHAHFGEEKPLVGKGGSGTIFLSHCSLRCVFCINWEISHSGEGHYYSLQEFADMMLALQKQGCENINFVTPTHYLPHILLALNIAAGKGLHLPVIYNTHGWERLEILKYLNGIVDVYLPDFKYFDDTMAAKYSSEAHNYVKLTEQALLEMHQQVGPAKADESGRIKKGLMVRHLVMPNNVSGTQDILKWIAKNLPKDTYVNIMSQYRPMYQAFDYPEIARSITKKEYRIAVETAKSLGLTNLEIQGYFGP